MARPAQLWHDYGVPATALAVSAALHAAVMVGIPGHGELIEEDAGPSYTATLDVAPPPSATAKAAPAKPAPSPHRPAPRHAKAHVHKMIAANATPPTPPVPAEQPAPDIPPPEPAPPPSPPPPAPAKPEQVAMAKPAAPNPALDAPVFPVAALPDHLSVTYALTSAFADGRATYDWSREGDHYRIRSEAQAVGFFTLFLEGRIWQESEGLVTPQGLRPDHFVEHRPNADDEGVDFDWTYNFIVLNHGGEKYTAPISANSVDWLSMIFQLAAAPPQADAFDLQVFTQRKLYKFHLRSLGIEEIDVPIGRLRARHLQHVDAASGEVVDVWVGLDQHNLPVKLRFPVAKNRIMVEQVVTDISEH